LRHGELYWFLMSQNDNNKMASHTPISNRHHTEGDK